MLYRLVRSVKRPDSTHIQFVQRIPADVRSRAVGLKLSIPLGEGEFHHLTISPSAQAVRFSLRTRDPSSAKVRQATAIAHLEAVWKSLRANKPVALSHRQATALAGQLYHAWADGDERERTYAVERRGNVMVPVHSTPEDEEGGFRAMAERLAETISSGEPQDLEPTLGPLVDRLLLRRGINAVDEPSRHLLLRAFALALQDAFERRARNAAGDYSPDSKAERFPEWRSPKPAESSGPATGGSTLTGLVESWWSEAKAGGRKASTYESYRNTVKRFAAFLGHDEAARVTPDDVLRFKDARLKEVMPNGKTVSAQTVNASDLAGLKTVFGWAVVNRKVATNPAQGITVKVGKKPRLRSKGFTNAEAVAILTAASGTVIPPWRPGSKAQPAGLYQARAERWVPWLCCYTGARVGEMAQLRKQDVRREGELWVLHVTPEAGTVKTDEARDIVLHPHLVAMGFPAFAESCEPGHLFVRPGDGEVRGRLRGLKNRLAEFARALVPDPNVAPNHAWRHRFKTVGIEAGITPRVLDAIQGHAPTNVSDSYGDVTLKAKAAAMALIPGVVVAREVQP